MLQHKDALSDEGVYQLRDFEGIYLKRFRGPIEAQLLFYRCNNRLFFLFVV